MIARFSLPFLAAAVLFAQDPAAYPQPPDLKSFLNLTDQQLQSLVQLQQQKAQTLQTVLQQTTQAQQQLQQALTASHPDPAAVGQLVIAVAALTQQAKQIAVGFQMQAVSLLEDDQKMKLPPLQLALELGPTAHEAASLGLLNAP